MPGAGVREDPDTGELEQIVGWQTRNVMQLDGSSQMQEVPVWGDYDGLVAGTFQLGLAINWHFWGPAAGSYFVGIAIDSHGHVAGYGGGGLGLAEGAGASLGVQFAGSNGNSVCALGGPFTNVSGTGGVGGVAGTGDYFQGAGDAPGGLVQGGGVTVGLGGGAGGSVQMTGTQVVPFGNHTCVNGVVQ